MADDKDSVRNGPPELLSSQSGIVALSLDPGRIVARVVSPGRPAFQLRPGELGLSVFDLDAVHPPLTEPEILLSFQAGSLTVRRAIAEIQRLGLRVAHTPGDPKLSVRLQQAHAEIVPSQGMSRAQFKAALKGI